MSFEIIYKGGEANVLDHQTKAFLDSLPQGSSDMIGITPDDIRSGPSPTLPYNPQPVPVDVEEICVAARDGYQIRVRIYRKDENTEAAPLMFYHGGCWVFCNLDSHDSVCRQLCQDSGMTVFSVDYRLAPESKFPTGIQDAFDAAAYVANNRAELKITSDDLIVAGDSAGGNISTVVSLMAKDSKELSVRGQLLYYPITDASRMDNESYSAFGEDHFLTKNMMKFGANHYARNADDFSNPLMSPLLSNELEGMPKTLIQTAEFDVLRDEAEAYAVKLDAAGVDVECVRYKGMIHAYIALAGKIDLAKEAISDSVKFLNSFK
ncbi:MAG: alpha/beta hydrolase [Lentisphaeraceae bacterium]|nr:alpha/beta hydrolase [Lentisphaeraceae bacterium]